MIGFDRVCRKCEEKDTFFTKTLQDLESSLRGFLCFDCHKNYNLTSIWTGHEESRRILVALATGILAPFTNSESMCLS